MPVSYRFTGNPFVDAGIAGLCAAAGVGTPEELTIDEVKRATDRIITLFTSPQALEARQKPGNPKAMSAFATSEMSAIFPNGPHSNPANKQSEKADKYKNLLLGLIDGIEDVDDSQSVCFACGRPAGHLATKADFPLVDSASRRNFHPGLNNGHPICARCALAVQFLPLSTLRTNVGGLFWFVSSFDPDVSIYSAATLNIPLMDKSIAANERVRFYGDWALPGRSSAVVNVIDYLTAHRHDMHLSSEPDYPTRAIFFSNDNRGGDISMVDMHEVLFRFFSRLRIKRQFYTRFTNEVMHVQKLAESVAQSMLNRWPIVRYCVRLEESSDQSAFFKGGWYAHALYMKEVLGMQDSYIKAVEQIALQIAAADDPTKELKSIKVNSDPMDWFIKAVRKGYLSREELYKLVPPNDYKAADRALDYVLAATADIMRCSASGDNFEKWDNNDPEPESDKHPIIALVERVGGRVLDSVDVPKKLLTNLRLARNEYDVRRAWLRSLERGAIGWTDFVELVPPEGGWKWQTIRDYMLAYLFDCLRDKIEIEDIEEPEPALVEAAKTYEEEDKWPTL